MWAPWGFQRPQRTCALALFCVLIWFNATVGKEQVAELGFRLFTYILKTQNIVKTHSVWKHKILYFFFFLWTRKQWEWKHRVGVTSFLVTAALGQGGRDDRPWEELQGAPVCSVFFLTTGRSQVMTMTTIRNCKNVRTRRTRRTFLNCNIKQPFWIWNAEYRVGATWLCRWPEVVTTLAQWEWEWRENKDQSQRPAHRVAPEVHPVGSWVVVAVGVASTQFQATELLQDFGKWLVPVCQEPSQLAQEFHLGECRQEKEFGQRDK